MSQEPNLYMAKLSVSFLLGMAGTDLVFQVFRGGRWFSMLLIVLCLGLAVRKIYLSSPAAQTDTLAKTLTKFHLFLLFMLGQAVSFIFISLQLGRSVLLPLVWLLVLLVVTVAWFKLSHFIK